MQTFSRFTMFSSLLSLLVVSDVCSGLSIHRRDTTNPAQLVLWDPKAGVQYRDIAQGTTGDCWLDASMASIALADPKHIQQIMTNDGAQADVTLWDDNTSNTYKVQKRTVEDMRKSFSDASPKVAGGQWIWPACMEDAFLELAQHSNTGINSKLDGGTGLQALKAIYGPHTPLTWKATAGTSDDDLWAIWQKVDSKPTVTGIYKADNNGLPSGHVYSAMRCDRGKGIVTLRNPWGLVSQKPTSKVTHHGDGVFDISFEDWKSIYGDITAVS